MQRLLNFGLSTAAFCDGELSVLKLLLLPFFFQFLFPLFFSVPSLPNLYYRSVLQF